MTNGTKKSLGKNKALINSDMNLLIGLTEMRKQDREKENIDWKNNISIQRERETNWTEQNMYNLQSKEIGRNGREGTDRDEITWWQSAWLDKFEWPGIKII